MGSKHTPDGENVARTSLKYETVSVGSRLFVIQEARWSDGSYSRSLAAVRLNAGLPVDIVLLDDVVPAPRTPALGPWELDEIPSDLRQVSLRQTETLISGALTRIGEAAPACEKGETRGIARIAASARVTPTVPRTEPGGDATLGAYPLGTLVCLKIPAHSPAEAPEAE